MNNDNQFFLQHSPQYPHPSENPLLSSGNDFVQGRWTDDQHKKFLQGVFRFGKDWKKIDEIISTRTSTQIRSHAQKYFIKFQKQQKERKKAKNKAKTGFTQLQKEIVQYFQYEEILKETPIEFANLLRRVAGIQDNFSALQEEPMKGQKVRDPKEEQKSERKISMEEQDFEQGQQSSYLIRTLKNNPDCLKEGHDFCELIDFGQKQNKEMKAEESETIEIQGMRKKSFALPDDIRNEEKMKEKLECLHLRTKNESEK